MANDNDEQGVSPQILRRLAALVEENGLSELRFEQGELRVTLRTAAYRPAPPPSAYPVPFAIPAPDAQNGTATPDDAGAISEKDEADETDLLRVEAPVMGVFDRVPNPDSPPFVEIGDVIEVGQVIGLIEAMKTFNEVPSDVAGRVRAIPAQAGALVSPGDPLIILESE